MSARPVIVCSHGFNDFHTIIVNMINDRIILKGLIERAYYPQGMPARFTCIHCEHKT